MKYLVLRALMKENDYSQAQLARKLGFSTPGALSFRMTARRSFSMDEAYTIMKLFNQPLKRLHEVFPPNGVRVEKQSKEA